MAPLYLTLAVLRSIAILGLLLLLINPKFTKKEYRLEKTNLAILLDNTSSLTATGGIDDITNVASRLGEVSEISERFNVQTYSFGDKLNNTDSLSFDEQTTNISETSSLRWRRFIPSRTLLFCCLQMVIKHLEPTMSFQENSWHFLFIRSLSEIPLATKMYV